MTINLPGFSYSIYSGKPVLIPNTVYFGALTYRYKAINE